MSNLPLPFVNDSASSGVTPPHRFTEPKAMQVEHPLPAGFGVDPSMLIPGSGLKMPQVADGLVGGGHADAPCRMAIKPMPASFSEAQRQIFEPARQQVSLDPDSFYLGGGRQDEPEPEPAASETGGVILTTAIVGAVLALMGYFLDFG
ncbi:hypothetical protein NPA31_001435 [Aurantimonas sp. MSK8Z-1]|uniref:hypothetical protein n=1 Tax=Mangrovibrevibacter kandeliae TaxID=2968473 RepID=UPI002118E322|nr:hypothetical protein [Aurantimonas sp. MSK8Z-1]MCW4113623.1 hypothetical protein [Aurantimonas sp. MSK8Z-1]